MLLLMEHNCFSLQKLAAELIYYLKCNRTNADKKVNKEAFFPSFFRVPFVKLYVGSQIILNFHFFFCIRFSE